MIVKTGSLKNAKSHVRYIRVTRSVINFFFLI